MTATVPIDQSNSSALPLLKPAAINLVACILPLLQHPILTGFPSSADGYVEKGLDLNTYLIRIKAAIYFLRISGDSMIRAHIQDGDMLIVDRSIESRYGHIVFAIINSEYTVKRLYACEGIIELRAENPAYSPICLRRDEEMQVWGVAVETVSRFNV